MVQDSASGVGDLELAELEVVLAALERAPRLARLLRYVGERALQGKREEITEYNIATEVFDRSKASFDGSTDSIARVETHRLRKRLKEYYETEGKEHPIVISIPIRSYVPDFRRRDHFVQFATVLLTSTDIPDLPKPVDHSLEIEGTEVTSEAESAKAGSAKEGVRRNKAILYGGVAAIFLALAVFGVYGLIAKFKSSTSANSAQVNSPAIDRSIVPPNAAHVPLRLLAGYSGSPKVDSAGAYWEADRYFSGGGAFERPEGSVLQTSDQMLFEYWRTGDFTYDIPLAPGLYELHLFFVASPSTDLKSQFFNVSANGQQLLRSFNISADVLGANIADEKVFRDISPDKDGYLHLKFVMDRAAPTLNAIEILPGLPHQQQPVRLVMQSSARTDHSGNAWHPDNYFENGVLSDPPRQVSGTPDPNLYAQERFGHFAYSIPVDKRDRYTVVLHFAELYWVKDPSGSVGVGTRVFSVYSEGTTLLDHFDIFKEAGSLRALTKTFYHLRPTMEGKINLTFEPIVNYATVSAIEVIDEGE